MLVVFISWRGREVLHHFNLEIPEDREPTEEEEEIRQVHVHPVIEARMYAGSAHRFAARCSASRTVILRELVSIAAEIKSR